MKKLCLVGLFSLLLSTACLAQGSARKQTTIDLARVLDTLVDVKLLGRVIPLRLTDAQFQGLAAIYKQYPPDPSDPVPTREAADKFEQFRARLIAGTASELAAADEQELQQILDVAFSEFSTGQEPEEAEVTELSAEETLIWAVLTPSQKRTLLAGGEGDGPQVAAKRALGIIGQLRGKDTATWTTSRDRLAGCLSSAAGVAGTPARENSRQMFVDFLNRVKAMSEVDLAGKQQELSSELIALLPPGCDLALTLTEFDPGLVHNALLPSFLSRRSPGLLREMQAAQTEKPGG